LNMTASKIKRFTTTREQQYSVQKSAELLEAFVSPYRNILVSKLKVGLVKHGIEEAQWNEIHNHKV
jgi:hypothetical protein